MQPNRFIRFVAFLVCLASLVALLFCCIRVTINNRRFFESEYTALDHARSMGMQTEELTDATMQMIKYMEGTADSIDITVSVDGERDSMFNDRERAHMVDVRALYQNFSRFATVTAAVFVILLAFSGRPISYSHKGEIRKMRISSAKAFLHASAAFLLIMLAAGAWVLIDFNSFWISFHLLFFTNDLWILDPATSRMINMMPWELFYDIVLRAGGVFVAAWAAFVIVASEVRRRERKAGL